MGIDKSIEIIIISINKVNKERKKDMTKTKKLSPQTIRLTLKLIEEYKNSHTLDADGQLDVVRAITEVSQFISGLKEGR